MPRLSSQARFRTILTKYYRKTYPRTTFAGCLASYPYPIGSTGAKVLYNLTLGVSNGAATAVTADADGALTTTWEISAVPANRQAKDGMMKLNNLGQSCWNKGNATSCNVTDPDQSWRNK